MRKQVMEMHMKKTIAISAVMLLACGCGQMEQADAKAQLTKRWQASRAQLLFTVAAEQYRVGQVANARAKATEVLALDEGHMGARLLLGKIYIADAMYPQAMEELDKVVARLPEWWEGHYVRGVALERQNKLQQALTAYRKAQALQPSGVEGATACAEVLVALGKLDEARLCVDSYAPRNASDPVLFELGGKIAVMQQDYQAAAGYYQQALELDPRNLHYKQSLATSQYMAGQHDEAIDTLKDLLAGNHCPPRAWMYAMLGECYLAKGRPADARDAFTSACDLAAGSPGPWVGVAKAALGLGDCARAILAARQALTLDSENVEARMVLGYALLRDSQAAGALSVLKPAAVTAPDNAVIHCLLGSAYGKLGQTGEARQCYEAALRADPGNVLAAELLSAASN